MASALRVPVAEIYAIDVSFSALKDKAEFDYLNLQPTTFVLPPRPSIVCAPRRAPSSWTHPSSSDC